MIHKSLGFGTLALLAAATASCLADARSTATAQEKPFYTTVDAGQTLTTDLGEGAGVFVEYQRGGNWRVWTSCDKNVTGRSCHYEVTVSPRAPVEWVNGVDLESNDYYERNGDGTITFVAETGADSDAIEFATKPGALVDIELTLDGNVDPSYFVWFGNDDVRRGAPSSPVVFQPDAP